MTYDPALDARLSEQRRVVDRLRAGWTPPLYKPAVVDPWRTKPAQIAAITQHGIVWRQA